MRLWATTPGTFKQVFSGHANDVANVTFAAQRPLLASSSDDTTIRLWDVARGELVRVFYGHQNRVLGLRFIEADQYLVSASFDRTLRLWDRQSGTTLRVFQGHTATVNNIAVYEDQIFSASHDGTVRRWQVHLPYQNLVPLPAEALSVAIAPNGQYVAVGLKEGILCLYTIKTDTLWCQPPQPALKGVLRLAFHPQSQLLASIYLDDNLVKLWQLNQGRLNEYKTVHYPNAIRAVAFSPQGEQLALADNAGQVWLSTQFLSSQSQELSFSAHEDKIYSLTFNRQGNYLLSSGKEGYTRLWSLETSPPTLVRALPPAKDELMWATISPNNQLIASVGREQKAFVYAMGNQGYYSLPGHEQTIYRAAFSPDNQHLITASGDATVRFWDLTQRRELFTLRLPVVAGPTSPLWDFDFRCHAGVCWMAVPLTSGRLVVYRLPNVYTP
ncbi:MAG: WD40 repeat domain-containing protein [Pseudomonadota bacterium]|nr:WD40 repeat domain-containing protein [Pseudomonadota bacterium]